MITIDLRPYRRRSRYEMTPPLVARAPLRVLRDRVRLVGFTGAGVIAAGALVNQLSPLPAPVVALGRPTFAVFATLLVLTEAAGHLVDPGFGTAIAFKRTRWVMAGLILMIALPRIADGAGLGPTSYADGWFGTGLALTLGAITVALGLDLRQGVREGTLSPALRRAAGAGVAGLAGVFFLILGYDVVHYEWWTAGFLVSVGAIVVGMVEYVRAAS